MSPNLPSDTPKPPSSTSPDPARIPSNLPDLQELPNLPELQELREPSKPSGRAASGGGWRRSLVRLIGALALPVALLGLAGCDYFAEKKLVPGVHTEADVRNFMGKPEMIREEPDGSKRLEYPRGPMGAETYFVYIGKDGKYKGMEKAMNGSTPRY